MSKELGNRISILLKKQIMKLFLKSDITTKKVSAMVTFCMFMFTIHPESNITDKQISS